MAGEPINKSVAALRAFMTAVQEENAELTTLLTAMESDPKVANDQIQIASNEENYENAVKLTWNEFCTVHGMDGDRFKNVLEALMDLETPAVDDCGRPIKLRDFGGDNDDMWVLKVGMLTSGTGMLDASSHLWVKCAMFLARHIEVPMPACMRVP